MNSTLQIDTPRWALRLHEHHRYKGLYGGRGGAKSWTFAELMILKMVINPDLFCVCIREYLSSISMSVKRLLEFQIEKLGVGSYFIVQDKQIKSAKGKGLIRFQGMQEHTKESIKSLEGIDICWCEESQTLSKNSLDMLRPTIRKDKSEMWFSWNPDQPTDPIDVLLRSDDLPEDSIVICINYNDNPWFPNALRAEMEYDRRRDPDKYAHVWKGEYQQNSEARVFHNWIIKDFNAPEDAFHTCGADWGFSQDPTVMVRSHVIGRNLYIDYEAYQIGCEILDTPDLFMEIPNAERYPCSADSARPETISHMRKHGFPKMFAATKGKNSVYEGITFLKTYDIVIHSRCRHTIDEFTRYRWKVDKMTGLVTNVLEDKKNHLMDALRYSNERRRRAIQQQKVEDVPIIPTEHRWNDVSSL